MGKGKQVRDMQDTKKCEYPIFQSEVVADLTGRNGKDRMLIRE